MIAILTDKPSVGKEIGRIIGATKVRNGYVEGNGYMVTWTFGNMLSLAMPKAAPLADNKACFLFLAILDHRPHRFDRRCKLPIFLLWQFHQSLCT